MAREEKQLDLFQIQRTERVTKLSAMSASFSTFPHSIVDKNN